jgi:WW domain-containing oxidoreductase
MSMLSWLSGRGASGFGAGATAEAVTEGLALNGKTFLVTGASSGIGLETTRVLALRGARVVATARSLEQAKRVASDIGGDVLPVACELREPSSVLGAVAAVKRADVRLDAIICNAGVMALPKLERACGVELQFWTNHVAHFLLVTKLLDSLAPDGRVVMVSSELHRRAPAGGIDFDNLAGEKSYQPWQAYARSKLANLLFAKQLARRFAGTARTANAIHPGVINTGLQRNMPSTLALLMKAIGPLALKTVAQGAATQVFVATRPELSTTTGAYFADCNVKEPRSDANDVALAERLWQWSERVTAPLA